MYYIIYYYILGIYFAESQRITKNLTVHPDELNFMSIHPTVVEIQYFTGKWTLNRWHLSDWNEWLMTALLNLHSYKHLRQKSGRFRIRIAKCFLPTLLFSFLFISCSAVLISITSNFCPVFICPGTTDELWQVSEMFIYVSLINKLINRCILFFFVLFLVSLEISRSSKLTPSSSWDDRDKMLSPDKKRVWFRGRLVAALFACALGRRWGGRKGNDKEWQVEKENKWCRRKAGVEKERKNDKRDQPCGRETGSAGWTVYWPEGLSVSASVL